MLYNLDPKNMTGNHSLLCGQFKVFRYPDGSLVVYDKNLKAHRIEATGLFPALNKVCDGCEVKSLIDGNLAAFAGRCSGGKENTFLNVGRGEGDDIHHLSHERGG
jgi:hypothetical protein